MIFALTNAVQNRIKRDSKVTPPRSSKVLTPEETQEDAFSLLLQQAETLSGSPVYRQEDWLQTEDGQKERLYTIQPDDRSTTTSSEIDLFFVHLRKEEGRYFLYFAHKTSALTIGYQMGSHKLANGRISLLEIFYAGMRRLGYSADTLLAYFTHSPLSAFTTSGDPAARSWMTSIIDEYYRQSPLEPVGKRLLERSNFDYNDNRSFLWRKDVRWRRPAFELFNDFLLKATGQAAIRNIPALRIQVRLLDPAHAHQAQSGVLPQKGTFIAKDPLPWRRFMIPNKITCKDLSEIIMACFGLLNYHWTRYTLRPDAFSLAQEIAILEPQDIEETIAIEKSFREDQPEEFTPIFFDQSKTEAGLLYQYRELRQYWQYDFGDNFWFEIESVEDASMDHFAVAFLDGGGDAPPTDVGGYSGFAEFLDALQDPSNDENAYHIRWAVRGVYWQPYNAEVIRQYLKDVNPLSWESYYDFDAWARNRDTDGILEALNVPPANKVGSD